MHECNVIFSTHLSFKIIRLTVGSDQMNDCCQGTSTNNQCHQETTTCPTEGTTFVLKGIITVCRRLSSRCSRRMRSGLRRRRIGVVVRARTRMLGSIATKTRRRIDFPIRLGSVVTAVGPHNLHILNDGSVHGGGGVCGVCVV
jgi:hypothetical protein